MLGYGFQEGETPAANFEESLSEDEDENLAQESSIGKGIYLGDMDQHYPHIDEDDQLVQALEESIQISRKSRGKGCKWWKRFKDFKLLGQTSSRGDSLQIKNQAQHEEAVICDICEEQIINSNWFRSYWGQTFCQKHELDGTPICSSCSRYKIGNIKFINLNDSRKLCPDCYSTAIIDSESCKSLVFEMYNFYEGLNMHIRKDIPVLLVDLVEMNRHAPIPNKIFLGLTTCKMDTITCVKWSSQRGENIEVVKQIEYLPRHCQVTSMLLLYGFPKLAIGATLAHEMMHTWMILEGYHGLERKVEEGMCEVMAHKWLECYGFFGEDMDGVDEEAQFLRNFKEHLKNRIERNYCRTYGDGFRDAKWAVERYGFKYTMKSIANTGKFPY